MNSKNDSDRKFQYPHRSYKLHKGCQIYVLEDDLNQVYLSDLNLVCNCIRFGLLQRRTLFSKGHIIFKRLPLKIVRLL